MANTNINPTMDINEVQSILTHKDIVFLDDGRSGRVVGYKHQSAKINVTSKGVEWVHVLVDIPEPFGRCLVPSTCLS